MAIAITHACANGRYFIDILPSRHVIEATCLATCQGKGIDQDISSRIQKQLFCGAIAVCVDADNQSRADRFTSATHPLPSWQVEGKRHAADREANARLRQRHASARRHRSVDPTWETLLTVEARKLYADGRGRETQAPMAENVEIGTFAAKDVIALQRVPIHSGQQMVRLVTSRRPSFAGADPFNVRIDRNSDDNVIATVDR